jgi:hypothetical protein
VYASVNHSFLILVIAIVSFDQLFLSCLDGQVKIASVFEELEADVLRVALLLRPACCIDALITSGRLFALPTSILQTGSSLKPIGYTWPYLACIVGHSVPIWQRLEDLRARPRQRTE